MDRHDRASDLRHALWLSALSIVWSGVVGSIAVYVALTSASLSLLGFGADAVIDAVASIVLVWRFMVEARQPHQADRVEQAAERSVGLALIALAVYLALGALRVLVVGGHPETSTIALLLLIASILVLGRRSRSPRTVSRRASRVAPCGPIASSPRWPPYWR